MELEDFELDHTSKWKINFHQVKMKGKRILGNEISKNKDA